MNRMSEEELEGVDQMKDGGEHGLELVKQVTFNELHVGVFYDEGTDLFTVDVYEIDEVTDRWTQCNGREALEVVMAILEEAFNG